MATKTSKTAHEFAAQLIANTDAFYADRVTYSEFSERNGHIWRAVEAAGVAVHEAVLRVLRHELRAYPQPALFSQL